MESSMVTIPVEDYAHNEAAEDEQEADNGYYDPHPKGHPFRGHWLEGQGARGGI